MTMTAGQLAECAPGDKGFAVERLKHWVKAGLVKPIGARKPGTGRHLRFPSETAVDVVVLAALADAGVRLVEEKTSLRGALSLCQAEWRSWWRRKEKGEAAPLFLTLVSVRNRRRGAAEETAFVGPAPHIPPGSAGHWIDLGHVFNQTRWPQELIDAVREEDSQ
jgi:hypothetical protein